MEESSSIINERLKFLFELEELRENQEIAIKEILIGAYKNYFISMASKGGKSLCYQIPALHKSGITIVFVPSLALISDLLEYFESKNIAAKSISSLNKTEWNKILKELGSNSCSIKFFMWTPEMKVFKDLSDKIEHLIESGKVDYFVVDEAHYIDAINANTNANVKIKKSRSGWFDNIKKFRNLKSNRASANVTWIVLTTASEAYKNELSEKLSISDVRFLKFPTFRHNIFYKVLPKSTKFVNLVKVLLENHGNVSGIIFCKSGKQIAGALRTLQTNNISAIEYYGKPGISKDLSRISDWAEQKFKILVAKGESFGFGLNTIIPPSIRFAIHRYVPENLHAYYHESGRVGNDEKLSFAFIIKDGEVKQGMEEYFGKKCRHQTLSKFFGEDIEACKTLCDACDPTNKEQNIQELILQKLISIEKSQKDIETQIALITSKLELIKIEPKEEKVKEEQPPQTDSDSD